MSFSPKSYNEQQVLCPHCWHQFYADQAWYIAGHPDLYGDPVLGENEKTRIAPHDAEVKNGSAFDSRGGKMNERACPVCHLQIPPELLKRRGKILSLVGAPSAGKTYFLTSMLHHLRSELTRNFGFALRDSDSHEIRVFLNYESKLFGSSDPSVPTLLNKTSEAGDLYNNVMLGNSSTPTRLPKPLTFSLTPTLSNPSYEKRAEALHQPVVLYDNAGESFDFLKENDANSRVTQHLSMCEAVMFAFDPTLDARTRSRLQSVSDDPQVNEAGHSYRQESILTEVTNRMRRQRNLATSEPITSPLLVCVQKYDLWKSLVPHATTELRDGTVKHNIDHSSVEYFKQAGIAGFDFEEVNRISVLIRAFLQDVNPTFVELAESQFSTVRYFPVSALGTSPEIDPSVAPTANPREFLKVRPDRISPFRVTHPFLWLMLRWKLIRPLKRRKARAGVAHAEAKAFSGKLRIRLPESGRIIVLDNEYAESEIIDPFSGDRVWIPAVDAVEETLAPPEATVPKRVQSIESLQLKKPTPPTPQNRGWFKK